MSGFRKLEDVWKKWKKPWGRNTQKKYLSKIPVRSQGDREKVFIAKEKNL
jgi:hypothetical protein